MPIIDPRDRQLADVLIKHSVKAKKGDLVYIDAIGLDTVGLAQAIAEAVLAVGAAPHVQIQEPEIRRSLMVGGNAASHQKVSDFEFAAMKNATCYIGVRGSQNNYETADVPRGQMSTFNAAFKQVLEQRVNHTRWCVMRYPNPAMAQLAQTSRESFAKFYYDVCTMDYAAMDKAAQSLKKLMEKTDRVHLKGPGTDLQFSIKGIKAIPCSGTMNIPDGETFTAPVKDSINGTVHFNAGTIWEGSPYDQINLTFKDGKIVSASAADKAQTAKLNKVLDQDEGARYVGEFAIGYNPHILHPMRDILFDEKIGGSFHMAMGRAYEEADNGNRSSVHWDMVCIQRPDYGGGEIWFDGKLIRKDGIFTHASLLGLNPDALMGGKAKTAPKAKAKAKKK